MEPNVSDSSPQINYTTTSLQDAVEKLYEIRDHFYDDKVNQHTEERIGKWELVKQELKKTITLLENVIELSSDLSASLSEEECATYPSHSILQYLLGKARNVLPDFDPKAQEHLSLAIKLNPSFVDAWNELGECYWKAGNTSSAQNCFTCAVEKKRNKVSLRNLSVVKRQVSAKDAEERRKLLFEGLQLAKEALQLDPSDGQSWLILGNALLSVAFYSAHNEACIQKALSAYGQAEKYDLARRNFNSADLYFNKAAALIYDERYEEALVNLKRSQEFDPCWELPKSKHSTVVGMLLGLNEVVALKGKLKQRKLKLILKSTTLKDWGPFHETPKFQRIALQNLVEGVNPGKFLLAKVVASVACEGGSPFACCVCDDESYAVAVTIYRLSLDYGPTIGDSILIPEPQMHVVSFSISGKPINFPCVRVDSPQSILVNGHTLKPNQLATMFMKFSSVG